MLIPLGACVLTALCVGFSWRALVRCKAMEQRSTDVDEPDELELRLLARERSLQLGLAKRNVQALGRVALFGGTSASFWAFTGGGSYDLSRLLPALLTFVAGTVGWGACSELHRRVGSLADSRRTLNRGRGSKRPATSGGPA